jgi:hypothetical protein
LYNPPLPTDYPDPAYWGYPKSLKRKQKEKRREDEKASEAISPTGSVLDYPHGSLDPAIWEYEEGEELPKLQTEVKSVITKRFHDWASQMGIFESPEDWIKEMLFIGSEATTQWKETSDIDITVVVNGDIVAGMNIIPKDLPPGEVPSWLGTQASLSLNGKLVGTHPVNYWIVSDTKPIDLADAIYNLNKDTWIKPPPKVPEEFDPEEVFADVWSEARSRANSFDVALSEIRRDIDDYVDLTTYRKQEEARDLGTERLFWIDSKMTMKRTEIENGLRDLLDNFKEVRELKEKAYTTQVYSTPEGELYFSRNWLPAALVWKWLSKYKYLELLKNIVQICKEEPEGLTEEKIWRLREVLS